MRPMIPHHHGGLHSGTHAYPHPHPFSHGGTQMIYSQPNINQPGVGGVPSHHLFSPQQQPSYHHHHHPQGLPLFQPYSMPPISTNQMMPGPASQGYGPPTTFVRVPSQQPTSSSAAPVPQQRGPTVYIGHLKPDTDDAIVRQLLSECGRVVRWARSQDPSTKKLSTFGFCEFESPLGVIRAVRCLNGLIIDGQSLVANCEDKVKDGLEHWRKDRHNKLQEENPSKSTQEIEAEIEKEDLRIEQTVLRIGSEYNQKKEVTDSAVKEPEEGGRDSSLEPPTRPHEQLSPHELERKGTTAVSSDGERREQRQRYDNQQATKPDSSPVLDMLDLVPAYVELPSSQNSRPAYKDVQRIQRWNHRLREIRGEFRKRVYQLERGEARMIRDRLRLKQSLESGIESPCAVSPSQHARLIDLDHRDVEYSICPDGSIWEGPLIGRQQQERMEWLMEERQADEEETKKEEEERLRAIEEEKKSEKRKKEEEEQEEEERKTLMESLQKRDASAENNEPLLPATEASAAAPSSAAEGNQSNKFKALTLKFGGDTISSSYQQPLTPSASTRANLGLQPKPSQQQQSVVASVFRDTDEDDDHAEGRLTSAMDLHLDREAVATEKKVKQENRELLTALAAQIPKTTEDLFRCHIDWDTLHQHRIFTLKVEPWVSKKVAEFLGEVEPELAAFISKRISQNPSASSFLEELREFLDEDAEGFVAKLWKMLLFEVLRLNHNSSTKK